MVTSIGNNSYFWAELTDREATLFHSTLGMCTPAAFGLAMALPQRKVLALDSDGNLLLNLGVLGTIANENPTNLTVLVMDNRQLPGQPQEGTGDADRDRRKNETSRSRQRMRHRELSLNQDVATFREKVQTGAQNRWAAFYLRASRSARP